MLLSIPGKVELNHKLPVLYSAVNTIFLVGLHLFLRSCDITDGCISTHVKESMTSHYYMKRGKIFLQYLYQLKLESNCI